MSRWVRSKGRQAGVRVSGVLLFVMLMAFGCGGGVTPKVRLDMAVHKYSDALRWKRASVVASFLSDEAGVKYLEKHSAFGDDYRILDFEVQSMRPVEGGKKAISIIRFSWLRLPANVVEKTVLEQHWLDVSGQWKIVKQEVVRGKNRSKIPESLPF